MRQSGIRGGHPVLIAAIAVAVCFTVAESLASELGELIESYYETQDVAALGQILPRELSSEGGARGLAMDRSPLGVVGSIDGLTYLRQGFEDLRVVSVRLVDTDETIVLQSRFSGRFAGEFSGLEPNGMPVTFTGIDVFSIEDGRVVAHWGETDHYGLLTQLTMAVPQVSEAMPAESEIVYSYPAGTFLECIQESSSGRLYVSKLLTGEIEAIDPGGHSQVIARLEDLRPGEVGFICIVLDEHENLYATFNSGTAKGVWRIAADGTSEQFATLPQSAAPNGITLDGHGGLIIADNIQGLWRVDLATRASERWVAHPLLEQREYIGRLPAANGVQRGPEGIYVTNSDRGHIVRIPVDRRGRPGPPVLHASGIPGDDFAVSADGTLYVTTHPFNTLVEISPDGSRRNLGSIDESIYGPTAVIPERGSNSLLVVTDGGLFAPLPDVDVPPAIVRLHLPDKD